jgi:hypothetical protein
MAIVQDGKMNIREGIAALNQRIGHEEGSKKVATRNLARAVHALHPGGAPPDRSADL